tara:strand:- start:7494 stop:7766 length:273 start_codon:yes stop_codon:yes gene_type:complete
MSPDLKTVRNNLIKTKKEVNEFYKKYHEDIKKLDKKPFTQIILLNQLLKENKLLKKKIENQKTIIQNFYSIIKKTNSKRKLSIHIGQIWS